MIHSANIRNPKQITTKFLQKKASACGVIHSANIRNPKQITTSSACRPGKRRCDS